MTTPPTIKPRAIAPSAVDAALTRTENQFGTRFDRYAYYTRDFLGELHRSTTEMASPQIAVDRHPELLRYFDTFAQVANDVAPSAEHRHEYFEGLTAVYAALDQTPARFLADMNTAFVAPEREGRILAQKMSWLPAGHSFYPDMKRVPYEGGLLVGLSEAAPDRAFDRVEVIDGAIASGATVMTVLENMSAYAKVFDVYSVHATFEGLRALAAFARLRSLDLNLFVGHATGGLSNKFYAVDPADANRLVVGDLGDTISDLA